MNAIFMRASLAAAALACLFTSAPSLAQGAARGPWAKVPALSTLCYSYAGEEREPFYGKVEAAKAAIAADLEKQEAINAKIQEEYQGIDPMEMASRMQQWMMSNPEEAMKFMQGAQAAAQAVPEELAATEEETKARDAELKALLTSYEDARIQAYAPVEARYSALTGRKRTDRKELLHLQFTGDPSDSQARWVEGEAIDAAADKAYQALCPSWWGANGKFHAYLKEQKDWFVQKRIPDLEKFDAPKLQQYAIMNTPTATYRSTAELQAVAEYLDLVWNVFNARDSWPRCRGAFDCDGAK